MKRIFILVSMLFFNVKPIHSQQGLGSAPFIKNYTTEDFNGGIQSWGIAQDNHDVIYIANNFGLLEFDGSTWNVFPVKNETKVRSLCVGSNGHIYVGSQNDFGYFSPDAKGSLAYHSIAEKLPEHQRNFDEVWRIFPIGKNIFFTTFKNIYRYTPDGTCDAIEPKFPLEFSFMTNNKLYVLQWGHGLSWLQGSTLQLLPGGEYFARMQIASILACGASSLLVFTVHNGIFLYDGQRVKRFSPGNQFILNSSVINQAIMLKDSSFAIGTQNNGLIIMNSRGMIQAHIHRENGLLDQTIHSLFQDTHENLWLGLNNSIAMIEFKSPFSIINNSVGVSGTGYSALRSGSTLYLGTNSGLFYMDNKSSEKRFQLLPGSDGQVYNLVEMDGHILMCHHNGLYEIVDRKARTILAEKGVWKVIRVPQHPDLLLMGSYTGICLLQLKRGQITLLQKFNGFNESSRVLEFDDENNLWIAHGYKGIYKLRFDNNFRTIDSVRFYNSRDGLPADHVNNMEVIKDKLVFPALYGIFNYDKQLDRFVPDAALNGLLDPAQHIIEMEQTTSGDIYFITRQAVGSITFDSFGKPTEETKVFNRIKGLLNDDLGVIQPLDDKNILFGAKNGFLHYNASLKKPIYPYHTYTEKVLTASPDKDSLLFDRRLGNATTEITILPYENNSLTFLCGSSFFESPEKTKYQYYLENFDNAWSGWSNAKEKEYTNLPEGKYIFHLRSQNIYGVISEAEKFTFRIRPPFYRTTWAYAAYCVSGILLLSSALYVVDKKNKNEKRMMLLNQEKKLRAVTMQGEEEIVRLKNENLESQLDHMKSELASSTVHLINKNELLSKIKLSLKGLVRKIDPDTLPGELNRIIHNINLNLNSDDNWKQFELHFNNVHGNFTHRLLEQFPKLTPQEIKLCAYLRLNLNTKEIANLLNVSIRAVEISRYRLRKKLNLDRNANLTEFILKF